MGAGDAEIKNREILRAEHDCIFAGWQIGLRAKKNDAVFGLLRGGGDQAAGVSLRLLRTTERNRADGTAINVSAALDFHGQALAYFFVMDIIADIQLRSGTEAFYRKGKISDDDVLHVGMAQRPFRFSGQHLFSFR